MTPKILVSYDDDADQDIPLPNYTTQGAAGADVRANLPKNQRDEGMNIPPGARVLIPTGLRMAIPTGFEVQVRPRSGLALKQGLTVANAPGTIDSDYRGPVGVILINLSNEVTEIKNGDRIAQMVIAKVEQAILREVSVLNESDRGSGGFGSTGYN